MSRLIVLDFEATGLDPRAGAEPIELAVVVLDDSFHELAAAEWLIVPDLAPSHWDPVARNMHEKSGLGWLARRDGLRRGAVEDLSRAFLAQFTPAGPLHPVGNSVHFDMKIMDFYFPNVAKMFHHRHLDVSSIRMLGERVTTAPPLAGDKPHRAMTDVRRSIAELKYWAHALRHAQIPDSWGAQ